MATRSSVLIEVTQDYGENNLNNGLKRMQYYHHWDGYVNGVGLDLIKILLDLQGEEVLKQNLTDVEHFVSSKLNATYERESANDVHTDIEFLYVINFDNGITLDVYHTNHINIGRFESYEEVLEKVNPKRLVEFVAFTSFDKEQYYNLKLLSN